MFFLSCLEKAPWFSRIYSILARTRHPVYNAFLLFTKRLLAFAFNLFIFLPGLKATRKECRLAVLQNCSGNLSKYGKVTTFLFFLLSFVFLLRSLFHKPSHGFSGAPIRYIHVFKSMLCSSSARCFLSHIALALPTKPFIMALFILSG